MNVSRLRLVTFDVTGTLLKFRSSPGRQYGEIGAMYGVLADNLSLSSNFKAHWQKMNKEHPNFGLKTGLGWETWWKMIVYGTFKDSKVNVDEKKLDSIAMHLIEAYQTTMCWQQCYGAYGLLSYLKNKGIPLGIISNFDPRLHDTLVNTRLRHFFNFVLTSYESGIEKPHPKIFETAIEKSEIADLKPEECLHVGNVVKLDYVGAKSSGWHGVLIHDRPPQQMKDKYPEVEVEHVFGSLYDLHKHLVDSTNGQVRAESV